MEKESLIVAYDGVALKKHEFDVEELAVSLTGIANLLKQAVSIINKGQNSKISIKVTSLTSGSFEIHLIVEQLKEWLGFLGTNPQIAGLRQILDLLGLSVGMVGLIQFVKKLKNNKIKNAKEKDDNNVEITYAENNTEKHVTINKNVYNFYNDKDIKSAISKILSPLNKEGIETFEIRDGKNNIKEKIDKSDMRYFTEPTQNQSILLDERTSDMWLSFVNISFKDGNKWRFFNGDNEFYASIEDQEFLSDINDNSIRFSKNDTIKATVKTVQNLTENGIKTYYSILKILAYKSITQLRLDLYKRDNDNKNNQ